MAPPFPLDGPALDALVTRTLAEDVGTGDITAQSCIAADAQLSAEINAREAGVLCGAQVATAIFKALDPDISIDFKLADGAAFTAGTQLAQINGAARAVLTAERSALNMLQVFSGIAEQARRYADEIAGTNAKLLDTRKTIPGLRLITKYATACGGAVNHRVGLFDAIMIKDNHIAVAGSVAAAIGAAQAAGHTQIQVECDRLDQARSAVDAGATSLLLDNMDLYTLRQAVSDYGGKVALEASGGVTLETIRPIAETGVDYISVGTAMTLSAPALDIGMDYALD